MHRWFTHLVCALACLGMTMPASAQAAEKITLAVMPLQPQGGVAEEKTRILDDLVASQMVGYTQYKVITAKDIEGLLGFDTLKQAFTCNASSCAQELGGALGVSQLITGSVSKLGSRVIFTLTRIDTHRAEVLGRGSATTQANDDDQLIDGLAQSLQAVMVNLDGQVPAVQAQAASPINVKPKPVTTAPKASPAPIAAVEAVSSGGPSAISWTLWGAGTVGVAAGTALWMQATSQEKASYDADEPGSQWEAYETPRTVTKSHIASGIGASLLTAGFINWLFFDEDDAAQATLMIQPSSTTISVGGTW